VTKIHFQYKWDNYDFGLNQDHFNTLLSETIEELDHSGIANELWKVFSKPAVKDLTCDGYEHR
jgi:hypothetical protein